MNMNLNTNMTQNLNLEQKLILTAEMQMSLKILQMPIVELQDYVEKELEENPVLEISGENISSDETLSEVKDKLLYKELVKQFESYDYYNEVGYINNELDDEKNPLNIVSEKKSLKDYLKEQLLEVNVREELEEICDYIIESLNDKGYLDESVSSIAQILCESVEMVENALRTVQDFHPYGVGARDLKECLKLQLKKMDVDEKIYEIIDEHLLLVGEDKYKEISKKLSLSLEDVLKYIKIIKSLEPKPSRGFYTGNDTAFVTPEAYIRKLGDDYFILMNDDALPRLSVNNLYKDILKYEENKETVDFIKNKINSAMYLIKGITQRKNTVYRILEKIIELQRDYFHKGESYLKPMTFKDVAESLDMHVSTVGRAIKDKYICTPFGTLKIKNLFTTGITSDNNEDISSMAIKKEIKRLISDEDKSKPVSDQVICDILKTKNIEISRRTVAKYRDELGIKPSSRRKNFI